MRARGQHAPRTRDRANRRTAIVHRADPPVVSRRCALAASALAVAGCKPPPPPPVPDGLAARGVHRIALDTGDAHGLSGLTVAADGALWTVAERARAAFRVELDPTRTPPTVRAITRHAIEDLPGGEDLESLGTLADGAFIAGTEGGEGDAVHVYQLALAGDRLRVAGPPITLGLDLLGIAAGGNHGAEGACAVPGLTIFAIEEVGKDSDGRWAPIVVMRDPAGDAPEGRTLRLRLTTATGKISALDCWRDGDRVRAIAIERHFEVTRILGFELPPAPATSIVPTVLRDLAPVLKGSLNLEGLVRLPDGHLVAVVDNQYGRITGPDELLWFADVPATW